MYFPGVHVIISLHRIDVDNSVSDLSEFSSEFYFSEKEFNFLFFEKKIYEDEKELIRNC